MCQAKVYLRQDGQEIEIMKEVIGIEITEEGLILKSFFEEPKEIKGRIREIDFLKHSVIIEPEGQT